MNFGFNSNVRCGKALFHVQTEDRGPARPYFDTVVYQSGRVVYKRSTSYEQFAQETEPEILAKKLHERLSQQHHEVIAALQAGTLELHSARKSAAPHAEPPAASARASAGDAIMSAADDGHELNLRLRNPKSWLLAGNISLDLELLEKGTRRRICDADVQVCLEHDRRRTPCAEERTDEKGCAILQFPVPAKVSEGSSLVVRASDGTRYGELRFRLKTKSREKSPVPVAP